MLWLVMFSNINFGDLNVFFLIQISEEKTLDEFMYFTLKQRLSNYTDVSAYMTVDELVMSSILLDRALTRELPSHINVTDAEQDIQVIVLDVRFHVI